MLRGRNVGFIVLGIWLILYGLLPHLDVTIENQDTLLDILAIVAGILILVGR